jgi:hypothetical protein
VYNEKELKELASLLMEKRKKGQRIFIISDEAYKKIIYDGIAFPNLFHIYEDTIVVTSHSKDLALPGERIGYIAISPLIKNAQALIDAAIFANRTLGFINAPAIMQRLVGKFQKNSVDIMDLYAAGTQALRLGAKGNVGIGGVTFDGTVEKYLTILNGTFPGAVPSNQIYIGSADNISNGLAGLSLYCEEPIRSGDLTCHHYMTIMYNGGEYKIPCLPLS